MLTIRMQRTGRSGHAQYRVIVQDSRFTPTSGRVVAYLGSYNPHTKEATLDGEKTSNYLSNGAQPSERVVRLLTAQGIKMPEWVSQPAKKERSIRNADKLRRNRPAEVAPEAQKPEPAVEETPATAPETETPETPTEEFVTEEAPAEVSETPTQETPAEEPAEPTEESAPAAEDDK
jgi:small subunit ribosomal protein S16